MLNVLSNKPDVKYILIVGNGINAIDASGEEVIRGLLESLQGHNVTLVFSGLKRKILKVLSNTGLYAKIGAENIHPTEAMAIKHIYQRLQADENNSTRDYCLLPPPKSLLLNHK